MHLVLTLSYRVSESYMVSTGTNNKVLTICRIYGEHPLIPFFLLFANVIQEPQAEQSAQDVRLMATAAKTLQQIQRFESSRACVAQLSSCNQAISVYISTLTGPASSAHLTRRNSTTLITKPHITNKDPFHTYTELTGRKRNKPSTTSCTTPWNDNAASARSQRSATDHTLITEQDILRPESWSYNFTNPNDMTAAGLDYGSPLSMSSRQRGLEQPIMGQMNEQQQQMENPQMDMAWAEDCGGYSMAMAPQIGSSWSGEFVTGFFGEEFAPRRSEQWLR